MTSVVISERFGGFGLSDAAIARVSELGTRLDRYGRMVGPEAGRSDQIPRDNPHLVQAVRDLGADASGRYANLVIVEVPDHTDWHLHEYDGYESLHEDHRTWTSEGAGENCP